MQSPAAITRVRKDRLSSSTSAVEVEKFIFSEPISKESKSKPAEKNSRWKLCVVLQAIAYVTTVVALLVVLSLIAKSYLELLRSVNTESNSTMPVPTANPAEPTEPSVSLPSSSAVANGETTSKSPKGQHAKDHIENAEIEAKYITTHHMKQKLDHFNRSSNATFSQRYFQYSKCFNTSVRELHNHSTALLFVVVAGEWTIKPWELIEDADSDHKTMNDAIYLACLEGFHALVIEVEHRYYGESQVVDVDTADSAPETLRFLRVEQAIEDLAAVIRAKSAEFKIPYSKVVLFGCSYAGTVSAYFRLKHPELCAGAVSFSGPLQPTYVYAGYNVAARHAFSKRFPVCYQKIDKVFRSGVIATAVKNATRFSDIRNDDMANLFNVTNDAVSDDDNITDLYQGVASSLQNILGQMQNNDNDNKIDSSCALMEKADIASLAAWFDKYYELSSAAATVNDTYMYFWYYQTCVQFGFFQSTTADQRDWFPPLEDGEDVLSVDTGDATTCWTNYSIEIEKVKENVFATNRSFMAPSLLEKLTNLLMVNGELDPWTPLAQLPPGGTAGAEKRGIKTIVVPDEFHCPVLNTGKLTPRHGAKTLFDELAREIGLWTS